MMLPNHSAESKTSNGPVPIALHREYLSRSRGIPAQVSLLGFWPLVHFGWFPASEQLAYRSPANGKNWKKSHPLFKPEHCSFSHPQLAAKVLAYRWHLRVFSGSQYMKNRASPHEKSFKELNSHWIIQLLSLSFADTFLTNILYHDPSKPFPKGKESLIHQDSWWLLQYLSHLSIRHCLGKLHLCQFSNELLTKFTTQSIYFLVGQYRCLHD